MKIQVKIAILLGIIFVSIFPILVKMEFSSPLISAFYRMAIASAVLLPYAIATKNYKLPSLKYLLLTLFCGCIFASDILVWNISIQSSTATQATLLANLSPVWVGLLSLIFLKINPGLNFFIGMIVALFGLVLLIGFSVFLNFSFDLAFGLGILSGFLYSIYIIVSKYVLKEVTVVPFMAYSTLSASVFLGIINFSFGEQFFGYSPKGWCVFLIQGLCCQLAAWLLLSYAMKNMKATRFSLAMLSQAFVTAILAVILLGEEITLQVFIGGIFILLGIMITFIKKV